MNKPTPFGKTYKEYTEELQKFSSVQKVELGLVDDIEKIYTQVIKSASTISKRKDNAVETIRTLKSESVKVKQDSAQGLKRVEEFKKAVKELGLEYPSRIKGLEKQFEDTLKEMEKTQSNSDKAMKLL